LNKHADPLGIGLGELFGPEYRLTHRETNVFQSSRNHDLCRPIEVSSGSRRFRR